MRILRLREVIQKTGLGRSSLYKFSSGGKFPAAIALGGKSVGWPAAKINQWIAQRIRKRDSAPTDAGYITPWAVTISERDTSETDLRVLRIRQVVEVTGLARATVYKYIHERSFPRPIPLAGASVGWLEAEVEYWLESLASAIADSTQNEPEASLKAP